MLQGCVLGGAVGMMQSARVMAVVELQGCVLGGGMSVGVTRVCAAGVVIGVCMPRRSSYCA